MFNPITVTSARQLWDLPVDRTIHDGDGYPWRKVAANAWTSGGLARFTSQEIEKYGPFTIYRP
jgi:hypothetical protein